MHKAKVNTFTLKIIKNVTKNFLRIFESGFKFFEPIFKTKGLVLRIRNFICSKNITLKQNEKITISKSLLHLIH